MDDNGGGGSAISVDEFHLLRHGVRPYLHLPNNPYQLCSSLLLLLLRSMKRIILGRSGTKLIQKQRIGQSGLLTKRIGRRMEFTYCTFQFALQVRFPEEEEEEEA